MSEATSPQRQAGPQGPAITPRDGNGGANGGPWRGDQPLPVPPPPTLAGWLRIALRGVAILLVLTLGVLILLLLRLIERPLAGQLRPASGPLVQGVCRICLLIMGIRWRCIGQPMRGPGAAVANHAGWLDIFVLNAAMPVFFVSKAEVARWPGINILTRVTGTHFVVRNPQLTRVQAEALAGRIRLGHRLLFFPEATSTDALRVLPFKTGLFQSFLDPDMPGGIAVQPVSVLYEAPPGRDARFYGWYGDMTLGPHMLAVLAQVPQGKVTVTLHPPVPVAGHDRKSLAAACETAVRHAGPGN